MDYHPYFFRDILSVRSVISVFHLSFEPNYSFKGETHNFWECVYVKSGSVGVTADDAILTLNKGQMVFHKPMEFHRIWANGGTAPEVIIFTFDCNSYPMKKFENRVALLTEPQINLVTSIVEESQRLFNGYEMTETHFRGVERENPCIGSGQALKIHLECLLIYLLRNQTVPQKHTPNPSGSALLYYDIINFLEDNIERSIHTDDICDHCHCSESNLKKVFRKYVGTGVMKHFLLLKLGHATRLLEEGLGVNEISILLGFSSPYYFSAAFKRELGVAPSQYIAKNKRDPLLYS